MNDRKLMVHDLESDTVNELVSIDVGKDEVVMWSNESGYTGNSLKLVKIYYEEAKDQRLEKLERWLVDHMARRIDRRQYVVFAGHTAVTKAISRGMNDEYSVTIIPVNGDVDLGRGAGCELKINFDK